MFSYITHMSNLSSHFYRCLLIIFDCRLCTVTLLAESTFLGRIKAILGIILAQPRLLGSQNIRSVKEILSRHVIIVSATYSSGRLMRLIAPRTRLALFLKFTQLVFRLSPLVGQVPKRRDIETSNYI